MREKCNHAFLGDDVEKKNCWNVHISCPRSILGENSLKATGNLRKILVFEYESKNQWKIFFERWSKRTIVIFPVWLRLYSHFFLSLAFCLMSFSKGREERKILKWRRSSYILEGKYNFSKYKVNLWHDSQSRGGNKL